MEITNKEPYRVAFFTGALSTHAGGAPRSIAIQAAAIQALGCRTTIFAGFSRKYPLTPHQFSLGDCEIVASRLVGPSVLGMMPGTFRQFNRRVHEFDVVHLNGAWNLTTFIASRIATAGKLPYIISCRGHFGEYHFSRYRLLKPFLYHTLEKRNIRDATAMHVTADWERETSQKALGTAPIVKIPNAVDLSDFLEHVPRAKARKELHLEKDGFYVIMFGRVARQKNLPFLLNAFHRAQLPGNAQLLLVGPPEGHLKRELIKTTAALGLQKSVRFVDFSKGPERQLWLASADVFALPSFDENFCVAAIESIASGTHCLLSPHVGAVEYLPREHATVIPLDTQKWSDELRRLHNNRPEQLHVDKAFFTQFSSETVGAQWLRTYDELSGR